LCTIYFVDIDSFVGDTPPPSSEGDVEMAEAMEGDAHP